MNKPGPNKELVFYSLNYGDIQTVAMDSIERELTLEEITRIEDIIAENVNWYDAIDDAIRSHIEK